MKKTLSLLLCVLLLLALVPISVMGNTTQSVDSNGLYSAQVQGEKESSFTVTIPSNIILDGDKQSATYSVNVKGDISGNEVIYVEPDSSFTLSSVNKEDIVANVTQDKTVWTHKEMNTSTNGEIRVPDMSAGIWNGVFCFTVSKESIMIPVSATDKNGNNINATSNIILGNEKDILLNKLDESGLLDSIKNINGVEDIDVIIEVQSDDFDGLASTTFDVSNIAQDGDTVVILHFDETTQKWEYIDTVEVIDGEVSANFNSYSPVAFVVIKPDGSMEILEIEQNQTYELSGVWKFNDAIDLQNGIDNLCEQITPTIYYFYIDINFTTRFEYIGMALDQTDNVKTLFFESEDISDPVYRDGEWCFSDSQIVNFGVEPQSVSKEFYLWFTANAMPQ